MKKLLLILLAATMVLLFAGVTPASARDNRHQNHLNYRSGHAWTMHHDSFARPTRHHDRFYRTYTNRPMHLSPRYYPVYRNDFWHRHYVHGRYLPCHFYSGRHHYGLPYRGSTHFYRGPVTSFHLDIGIFR